MSTIHSDISRTHLSHKEVILVGTAHISQQSVVLVEEIIEQERPDVVCVELDEERFKAMREQQKWEELDLKQVIRDKKLMFLTARIALSTFQKRMGSYTGVKPGAEMTAAVEAAQRIGAQVVLCDRDVRTTLVRAWRKTPWYKRLGLGAMVAGGMFQKTEVNEEELAKLRESQNISSILDEMGGVLPDVKSVLVDERDTYMSYEIQQAQGQKVLVVIGAAHKPGIERKLQEPISPETIAQISSVPARSTLSKVLPWVLPVVILAIFAYGMYAGDWEKIQDALWAWVLANGVLSALGAIIALGHPLTVLAAFIAAPITSLNPTIGAGMVTAFVQVSVASPKVRDFERIGDDLAQWKGCVDQQVGPCCIGLHPLEPRQRRGDLRRPALADEAAGVRTARAVGGCTTISVYSYPFFGALVRTFEPSSCSKKTCAPNSPHWRPSRQKFQWM